MTDPEQNIDEEETLDDLFDGEEDDDLGINPLAHRNAIDNFGEEDDDEHKKALREYVDVAIAPEISTIKRDLTDFIKDFGKMFSMSNERIDEIEGKVLEQRKICKKALLLSSPKRIFARKSELIYAIFITGFMVCFFGFATTQNPSWYGPIFVFMTVFLIYGTSLFILWVTLLMYGKILQRYVDSGIKENRKLKAELEGNRQKLEDALSLLDSGVLEEDDDIKDGDID